MATMSNQVTSASLARARKDAHSLCSKGECSIVQKSNPEELRRLTPTQIRAQMKLTEKFYNEHKENYKRVGGGHKQDEESIKEQHHIKLKMSLMADALKRFKDQLKAVETPVRKASPKLKATAKKPAAKSRAKTARAH